MIATIMPMIGMMRYHLAQHNGTEVDDIGDICDELNRVIISLNDLETKRQSPISSLNESKEKLDRKLGPGGRLAHSQGLKEDLMNLQKQHHLRRLKVQQQIEKISTNDKRIREEKVRLDSLDKQHQLAWRAIDKRTRGTPTSLSERESLLADRIAEVDEMTISLEMRKSTLDHLEARLHERERDLPSREGAVAAREAQVASDYTAHLDRSEARLMDLDRKS